MARKRYLEPWWYMSNPFDYDATGRARITFPPVPQRTWNVLVGMIAFGDDVVAGAGLFTNIVRGIIVNENQHIIGPGAPVALIGSMGRQTGTGGFAPPVGQPPTIHGFGYWPGDVLELYDGRRVCGIPYEATSTVTVILDDLSSNPDNHLTQIGFLAVELPEDAAAANYPELRDTWERIRVGLGGVSFATHEIDFAAALANFDDATVLTTWHNYRLRRTDLRGCYLRQDGGLGLAPDENGFKQTTMNTRSDQARDMGVGFAPAAAVAGYGGLPNSALFPLDYRSNGEDREIITVNSPLLGVGPNRLYFASPMQGIEEREYFGRVAGQAF